MKKLLSLILALSVLLSFAVCFTSCGDSDDTGTTPGAPEVETFTEEVLGAYTMEIPTTFSLLTENETAKGYYNNTTGETVIINYLPWETRLDREALLNMVNMSMETMGTNASEAVLSGPDNFIKIEYSFDDMMGRKLYNTTFYVITNEDHSHPITKIDISETNASRPIASTVKERDYTESEGTTTPPTLDVGLDFSYAANYTISIPDTLELVYDISTGALYTSASNDVNVSIIRKTKMFTDSTEDQAKIAELLKAPTADEFTAELNNASVTVRDVVVSGEDKSFCKITFMCPGKEGAYSYATYFYIISADGNAYTITEIHIMENDSERPIANSVAAI